MQIRSIDVALRDGNPVCATAIRCKACVQWSIVAKLLFQGFATKLACIVRAAPKIARNDPCHCGSDREFKKCYCAPVCVCGHFGAGLPC
ncbi:MAG: SEC-C domain-containing protein [Propionivibrio sp.]|uniref:SEC-C metal-binding domain-containing protein n=1 Tax=Propionivibrio sp. TaxID=2212460 RepID=UPI001A57427E|nr:SEC-C domain-containing protein [Propionivibrio sp.]